MQACVITTDNVLSSKSLLTLYYHQYRYRHYIITKIATDNTLSPKSLLTLYYHQNNY
jgi:hypothetical protein